MVKHMENHRKFPFTDEFPISSGNLLQFAIEAMAIEIVDLPRKKIMFCHSYVSLPEGNNSIQFPEFALDGKTNTIQRFPVDSQVEKPTRPSENPRFINPSGDGKNK